mmetsp:Transcript_36714/g.89078  ORF Transcript_36714/g.89078 Transcript_36714/m.89078 type:complete len:161 (-) Transcript_36714:1485-1967(-)
MESPQETSNNNVVEPFVYTGQPTDQIPLTVKHVVVAESVLKIEDRAFEGNNLLKEIQFNNGLQIIGDSAFRNCFQLQAVSLPDTLQKNWTEFLFQFIFDCYRPFARRRYWDWSFFILLLPSRRQASRRSHCHQRLPFWLLLFSAPNRHPQHSGDDWQTGL